MTPPKDIRQTGHFDAVGDDGRTYLVLEYTEYHRTNYLDGRTEETPGLKTYKLFNGQHVNPPSEGSRQWVVIATGVKLTPT